jgi:hypothetical protein
MIPVRPLLTAVLVLVLAACGPDGAIVSPSRIRLSAPVGGRLVVEGAPGAVTGAGVTTVTLTVLAAVPASYRVAHAGSHLPVASSYASVNADGSFPAATLGTSDRPVSSGDELVITPQNATAQAGRPVKIAVP